MEDWKRKTVETYDASAQALAEYFKGIGPRIEDIERAIELAPGHGRVVEIGCGDGRDAKEIVARTGWYEGFDPSGQLLEIARKTLPQTSFKQADALSYQYPENLDVVYAFASLLHLPKDDLQSVFARVAAALRSGGIFYISLKERSKYEEEVKRDAYGERMFYYYTPDIIREFAGEPYESVYEDHQRFGNTDWFTLALKRR